MIALALLAILSGVDSDLSDPVPRQDRTQAYPRLDRRDRIGVGDLASFRALAPWSLPSTSGGCDGSAIPITKGPAPTFTRASVGNCTRGDGVSVLLGSDLPRVSSLGLLGEYTAATNPLLYSRDMTNAVWTLTNATAAMTATGRDAAANSATTLTATAGNATALQGFVNASETRWFTCSFRRITGSGNIQLTRNNGTGWTTAGSTNCWHPGTFVATAPNSTDWVRCGISSFSSNPTDGVRLVTSGDVVAVDKCGDQDPFYFPTSEVDTLGTPVTRAADNWTGANPAPSVSFLGTGCVGITGFSRTATAHSALMMFNSGGYPAAVGNADTSLIAYDGTNIATLTVAALSGRSADIITTWGGSVLSIREAGGTPATTSFDGLIGNASWIAPGSQGGQPYAGYISNVRLGLTTTACDQ